MPLTYIERAYADSPTFYGSLCENVALVKLAPSSASGLLEHALEVSDGVVVESFGTGGLPERFYPALERAAAAGRLIVATTQVPGEGSDMAVYKVGREIKRRLGLLESYDMTLEATLAKLIGLYALPQIRSDRAA